MWKLKKEQKKVGQSKRFSLSLYQSKNLQTCKIYIFCFCITCYFILPGTSNRTVAATQMNATSSRAHTVVTVTFDQISKNDSGQETKKSSTINLVDLAGKT